jgi:hypothetical protein
MLGWQSHPMPTQLEHMRDSRSRERKCPNQLSANKMGGILGAHQKCDKRYDADDDILLPPTPVEWLRLE